MGEHIIMGLMDIFRTKKNSESDIIEDMSYIADLHHIKGPWHQYDFLLASQGYGWDYIIDSADYMIHSDLEQIGTISITKSLDSNMEELMDEFHSVGCVIKKMTTLSEEASTLGVGGISKMIGYPVKIVWINQSRVLRLFTPIDDEDLLARYAESVIRRNFGTKDAMKKAKPAT